MDQHNLSEHVAAATQTTPHYAIDRLESNAPPRIDQSRHSPFYQRLLNTTAPNSLQPDLPIDALEANASPQHQAHSIDASARDYYFLFDQEHLQPTTATHSSHTEKPDVITADRFAQTTANGLVFEQIRRDFPILQQKVNGHALIWLDSAATTQKPQAVIDRLVYFYQNENSNIHRAAHQLAARATDAYEHARQVVADFIHAASTDNIVFVRGTTEAINLVAKSWGVHNIGAGDEIIISHLEHHANIVPWYQLCQQQGAVLRVIPVDDTGQIDLIALAKLMNSRTKLLAITQVSNALGTITPIQQVIEMAHQQHIPVLVDAAQSIAHMPTDVQALDADFLVFSGHKVFGPTGIGVLYAKTAILESMPVWEGGGNMIADVRFEHVIYQDPPNKFEAGTGNIADAVGLAAALNYIQKIGLQHIAQYEHELLQYSLQRLQTVPSLRLIGNPQHRASVMSFVMTDYSPEQIGRCLNEQGIAVRAGHHCAQPILRRFGVEKTVRPSIAFYNQHDEINQMVDVLQHLHRQRHQERSSF
ncbi:cysteine desulfurase [Acinetobacter larvae]|uniref:cysteine desulfurase n=1 Tax=Acinetobacter larvae TaxID=1789224 RepID=A0A1B2M437_9GAMM|nr:cysteine desulfurase [Acinetobacter larvae]